MFAILDQRNPQRTCLLGDRKTVSQFLQFQYIAFGGDGSRSGEDAYVACLGDCRHGFYRGTDYSKHVALGRFRVYDFFSFRNDFFKFMIYFWQVLLLNRPQGFCACSIASQNDQRAILGEEVFDGLEGIAVNDIERVRAIRRTGVVPQDSRTEVTPGGSLPRWSNRHNRCQKYRFLP